METKLARIAQLSAENPDIDEMITHNIFYTVITRSKQHLKILKLEVNVYDRKSKH